jgi:putative sigma-54 modulation protein
MEIKVSGRHIEVTPAIREYASEKALKLPRYFDRVQGIDVVINHGDHNHYSVEIITNVERTDPFIARASGLDLYACIDDAIDKMERQLTDHKQKLRNRKHNV